MSRLDDYRTALLVASPGISGDELGTVLDAAGPQFPQFIIDHGLGPMWHERTGREEFHASRMQAEALFAMQEKALADIDATFTAAGIDYVVIKGAANRLLLYENPAIRACYDARATDTGFQRLTFALFGSGSPTDIVNSVQGSPFEISVSIPLPDFSAQEMAGLLSGLGEPLPEAQEILSRVWTWTRGHPYLTQKLLRGLARRRDDEISADTVDELVHSQFLSPNTLREEPHLSAIADLLTAEDAADLLAGIQVRVVRGERVSRCRDAGLRLLGRGGQR